MKAVLLAILAAATTADANVWEHATHGIDPSDEIYAKQLAGGDEEALEANQEGASRDTIARKVESAITAYKTASAAKPNAAEPYWRIGQVLYSFYFQECSRFGSQGNALNKSPLCPGPDPVVVATNATIRTKAEETLAAWSAFEARAPLDPRITTQFLFERAILETKLATHDSWVLAAKDYEAILDRDDLTHDSQLSATLGNLAETYMMLDRLDDAIDMYRRARQGGGDVSIAYGQAVAFDRNGDGERAKDLIRDLGTQSLRDFQQKLADHVWFFVPFGEGFYYSALIEEADGDTDDAIIDYKKYIASGAHPEFQPRAKEHIADLEAHPQPKQPKRDVEIDWLP